MNGTRPPLESHPTYLAETVAPWPTCACGVRAPSEAHLRRHVEKTGCQGAAEYRTLCRRLRPGRRVA